MTRPWPPGAVTGLGSLPGDDPGEAVAMVFGELPDLPHLPELPARGPGATLIGRAAALLVDLPVEIVPSGWRLAAHAGRDLRTARDDLARDLDALEAHASDYRGALKLQISGPWTLAAGLELPNGHRLITDRGATRDLIESLSEGLREHVADVARRVPGAQLVVQLDEPSLPAVLGGHLSTPSGYGTVRSIEPVIAEQGLRDVLAAIPEGGRVVHCCADDVPIELLRAAGVDAVALDATRLGREHYDVLGETIDAGVSLWLGVLPAAHGTEPRRCARPHRAAVERAGFPAGPTRRRRRRHPDVRSGRGRTGTATSHLRRAARLRQLAARPGRVDDRLAVRAACRHRDDRHHADARGLAAFARRSCRTRSLG